MAKSIEIPEDYTVNNTSNLGTMTQVSGSNYSGTNITITDLRSKIGASSTALSQLAKHANVNKWAYFQSSVWDWANSDRLNGVYVRKPNPDGYALGDFIGYNHNAKPPIYWYEEPPLSIELEMFDNFSSSFRLARGESPPAFADPMVIKEKIDFEYQFQNGVKNHIRKAMGTGSYTSFTPNFSITSNGTLKLKPYYYSFEEPNIYEHQAMIEDGERSISVNVVSPKFSGTLSGSSSGLFNVPVNFSYSIKRTGTSSKSLYFRIRASSSGDVQGTHNFEYLSFSSNQTKSGNISLNILSQYGGNNVNVTVRLECSNSSAFSTSYTIASRNIVMSGGGGV